MDYLFNLKSIWMCGKSPSPACRFFLVMPCPKSYLIKIQVNLLKRVGEDHVQENNDVSEKYKMTQPVACVKYNDMSVSCFLFHLQQQETCQYIPKAPKRKKERKRGAEGEPILLLCRLRTSHHFDRIENQMLRSNTTVGVILVGIRIVVDAAPANFWRSCCSSVYHILLAIPTFGTAILRCFSDA